MINLTPIDKNDLIKQFNERGYLLEDKMIEILSNRLSNTPQKIWVGEIGREYGRRNNNERVEIDAILRKDGKIFVVEAKRTTYDWIFAPSLNKPSNPVNLVYHLEREDVVKSMVLDEGPIKPVCHDFAMGFDGEKLIRKNDGKTLSLPHAHRPVHDAIRQVLKESKAVLLEGSKYFAYPLLLMPIIVTNARLIYMDYDGKQINERGDLEDWNSLTEVSAVRINFPEYFGFNTEPGLSSSELEKITKTVFIVNIKNLKEIVNLLCGLSMKKIFGEFFLTSSEKVSEQF